MRAKNRQPYQSSRCEENFGIFSNKRKKKRFPGNVKVKHAHVKAREIGMSRRNGEITRALLVIHQSRRVTCVAGQEKTMSPHTIIEELRCTKQSKMAHIFSSLRRILRLRLMKGQFSRRERKRKRESLCGENCAFHNGGRRHVVPNQGVLRTCCIHLHAPSSY